MIWFTSDTHFYHSRIIDYCDRPYRLLDGRPDVQGMNRDMVAKWNEIVGKDDIVYHLGDFGFGSPGRLLGIRQALNGKIFLLRGNHDPAPTKWLLPGVDKWANSLQVGEVFMAHVPPTPPEKWHLGDKDGYQQFAIKHQPVPPETKVMLCGHVHNKWKETTINGIRVINVGVDVNDMRPIALNEIGLDADMVLAVHGKLVKE
jgi:calcineurin-like phosphoesterase family protein